MKDLLQQRCELGGRPHQPVVNAPEVVVWLALAIIASHIIFLFLPSGAKFWVAWYGAVSPRRFLTGEGGALAMLTPLVGHLLLHGGWLHVLFNSVWLLAFGAPVARRMGADRGEGAPRASILFLAFFALSGVAGALLYVMLHPGETTLLIGASGGVSGLLGGLVRFAFRRPLAEPGAFASLFDRTVLIWSGVIVGLNIVMGLLGPGLVGDDVEIAWEAHVGGYFFGLFALPFFVRLAQRA